MDLSLLLGSGQGLEQGRCPNQELVLEAQAMDYLRLLFLDRDSGPVLAPAKAPVLVPGSARAQAPDSARVLAME